MRFRTELKNIRTLSSEYTLSILSHVIPRGPRADESHTELTAALSSLEKIAWVRLSDDTVRFTVIPDMGSQVWASVTLSPTSISPFTAEKR